MKANVESNQATSGLEGNNPTLYGYVHDPNTWIDPFGLLSAEELWEIRQMGDHAEKVAQSRFGFDKNTERISSTQKGKYHIPDGKYGTKLFEIKCVAKQGLTKQIKSFMAASKKPLTLVVNKDTKISKPLQKQIDANKINLKRIDLKKGFKPKAKGCKG